MMTSKRQGNHQSRTAHNKTEQQNRHGDQDQPFERETPRSEHREQQKIE